MSFLAFLLLMNKADFMMLGTNKAEVMAGVVPDTQAEAHIGQMVTLDCNVANVKQAKNGMEFVDCGGVYPNMMASLVVFAGDVRAVGDLDHYKGTHVLAHGKLQLYKGKPELILKSARQLQGHGK